MEPPLPPPSPPADLPLPLGHQEFALVPIEIHKIQHYCQLCILEGNDP